MPNMTIRLPEEMWRRMKERGDINWTEVARSAFRTYLDISVMPANVDNVVRTLQDSNEWGKLLCLLMKAEGVRAEYVLKNLELMHQGDAANILQELDAKLSEVGLDPSLTGTTQDGRHIRDLVKEALLVNGAYDKLEEQCRAKLEKASWEVNEAAWLISQYFIEDPLSTYEFRMSLVPDGLERTLELMLGRSDLIDEIVRTGLIFKDLNMSRAYFHEVYIGAEYARPVFKELSTKKDSAVDASLYGLEHSQDFQAFLLWIGKGSGVSRTVVSDEEEKYKEELTGTTRPFDDLLKDLVKKYVVMVDFWPHRSRVGKRRSEASRWVFRLTPSARRYLVPHLLKMMVERQE